MIRHTRTFGAIGAALLSAIATAGCTNYIEANEPAPQILGVMVQDINDNEVAAPGYCSTSLQTCTADADCTGHCSTATLEACAVAGDCNGTTTPLGFCSSTTTWGCAVAADCPGHCVTATATGCATDEDCPPADTCRLTVQGSCSVTTGTLCYVNANCPTGETCNLPGHCSTTTATACFTLKHCSVTQTTRCTANTDCPTGETCRNLDCLTGETCVATPSQTCTTGTGQTCVTTPQTCTYNANSFLWPYPPRTGQMFAEGYVGKPGPSPATWSLGTAAPLAGGVPSGPWPSPKYGPFLFAKPRIIFNKLLDGPSIQPDPASCDPTANFAVTANGSDVSADFGVCYDPSSPTPAYGAAVVLTPAAGRLRSATTYSIIGTVKDKQNRDTPVDFTIVTAP